MSTLWQRLSYFEVSIHFRPFLWRLEFTPWAANNSLLSLTAGPVSVKIWRLE